MSLSLSSCINAKMYWKLIDLFFYIITIQVRLKYLLLASLSFVSLFNAHTRFVLFTFSVNLIRNPNWRNSFETVPWLIEHKLLKWRIFFLSRKLKQNDKILKIMELVFSRWTILTSFHRDLNRKDSIIEKNVLKCYQRCLPSN